MLLRKSDVGGNSYTLLKNNLCSGFGSAIYWLIFGKTLMFIISSDIKKVIQ